MITPRRPLWRPLAGVALLTAGLLLVPAVASRFTPEVNWDAGDYVVAAVLLLGAGTAVVVAARGIAGRRARWAAIGAIGLVLATVWAELAVGLFT